MRKNSLLALTPKKYDTEFGDENCSLNSTLMMKAQICEETAVSFKELGLT